MIVIYFDGACEPTNPCGVPTYGFVVYHDKVRVKEGKGIACQPFSNQASNNVAEYTALIRCLEYLISDGLNIYPTLAKGDSQLAVKQIQGKYAVNADRIIPLYERVKELTSTFSDIEFAWIPREENDEADHLSHVAYEEYLDGNYRAAEQVLRYAATQKQKQFMQRLGIKYDKYISKGEASRLISRRLKQLR